MNSANKISLIFDNKAFPVASLIAGVLIKLLMAWVFTDFEGDKALYLLLADNLSKGNGLLEPVTLLTGERIHVYNEAASSPIYSIIAAPFLSITGSYYTTSVIVDLISWIIFFTGLFKILQILQLRNSMILLAILMTALVIYPHEADSKPKDTLSIGLLLWFAYLTSVFVKSKLPMSFSHWKVIMPVCLIFLTKVFYAFALIMIAVVLVAYFIRKKNWQHLRGQLLIFFVTIIALSALTTLLDINFFWNLRTDLTYQSLISNPTGISWGFYPENLKSLYPFISASYFNLNLWAVQISKLFSMDYSKAFGLFRVIDLLVLAGLTISLFVKRPQLIKIPTPLKILILLSGVVLFALMLLSVTLSSYVYRHSLNSYTYVQLPRSFWLLVLTIQITTIYYLGKGSIRSGIIRLLIILLLSFQALHGLYFRTSQLVNISQEKQAIQNTPLKSIIRELKQLQTSDPALKIATTDLMARRYAYLQNIPVAGFSEEICEFKNNGNPVVVITLIEEMPTWKRCISMETVRVDTISPYVLYWH